MRSSFFAATAIVSALDLLTGAEALALPLRRTALPRQSNTANGTQTLGDFKSGSAYTVAVTINGQTFDAQIDTGSSDLWVETATPVPGAFDSTQETKLDYSSDSVKGEVKFANVTVGGFTIQNQIYAEVPPANGDGTPGIIGLAPGIGSQIFGGVAARDPRANATMDSLFTQHSEVDSFFTIQLNRVTELPDPTAGTITFGTTIPELSNITSQPKLPIVNTPAIGLFASWTVAMDAMTVNGQNVTLPPSAVDPNNTAQFVAVLDTGTTLSGVPKDIFDAIYGGIEGTVQEPDGTTAFPCDTELNLTFTFGGQVFPVHPLDVLIDNGRQDGLCSPQFFEFDATPQFDILLGDAFLRNAYMLNNFGDTIRGGPTQPYIQLLSTTNVTTAHEQFIQVRVNGANSTATSTAGEDPTASTADETATASAEASATDASATDASATGASATDASATATATDSSAASTDASSTATDATTTDAASTSGTDSESVSATDSASASPTDSSSVSATDSSSASATDASSASSTDSSSASTTDSSSAPSTDSSSASSTDSSSASATDSSSASSTDSSSATATDSSSASATDSSSASATDSASASTSDDSGLVAASSTDSVEELFASPTGSPSANPAAKSAAGARRMWRRRRL